MGVSHPASLNTHQSTATSPLSNAHLDRLGRLKRDGDAQLREFAVDGVKRGAVDERRGRETVFLQLQADRIDHRMQPWIVTQDCDWRSKPLDMCSGDVGVDAKHECHVSDDGETTASPRRTGQTIIEK